MVSFEPLPLEGGLRGANPAFSRLPPPCGTACPRASQMGSQVECREEKGRFALRLDSPEKTLRTPSMDLVGLAGLTNSLGKSQGGLRSLETHHPVLGSWFGIRRVWWRTEDEGSYCLLPGEPHL